MGCKKHPADLSSTVGVCASCLRDRLMAHAQQPSVSPYISRRKPDTTWHHHTPLDRRSGAGGRFRFSSLLSSLFRSNSESPSWFSSIVPRKRDRGMSPARYSDVNEHCRGGSSGYTSEGRRGRTTRRGSGHSRNLAVCLSPLVRASPNRQWNQKGEMGGAPVSAFSKNRSRKLADLGRYNNH